MSAVGILQQAREVLGGTSSGRQRMACWLARSALEEVVRDLLVAKGRMPGESTMASRLTCLEIAYADQPEVGAHAEFAWVRLSNGCHQHAFELSPTASEVTGMIDKVAGLAEVAKSIHAASR